ncbi:MAG: 4-hydroxy-tetrahydrodipicolinate synthase [Chloroflexi bacterium]|nr:4-hydroxy-tetrahydrodipicolinate synthase [Chloroflexota bacterium]
MNKKPDWFRGIIPALVTPFNAHGDVDETAYRALIRRVLPHVNGVLAAGTTGEFVYLSGAERKRLLEVTLDEVAGRVPVLAGTGAPSTRETIALTRHAQTAGATAALVVAPYYMKPSFNEVYDHFQALNSAVDLPLLLYNIPQCAGTHFQWWTAEGMAHLDRVVGIKDSSGDIPFLMALFEKVKGTIGIFTGHDETVVAALAAGADGAILASANLIPDIWQEIYQAVQAGNLAHAQQRQAEIQKLIRIVVRKGSTQAVKEGLRLTGLDVGDSRHPIMPGGAFEREDYEEVRVQLENLGKASVPARQVGEAPAVKGLSGDLTLRVGEGFSGPPLHEIAHIDLLLGRLDGPVGKAMERALAEGRPGHEVKLLEGLPKTLLVPTVTVRGVRQRQLVYDDAAQGVRLAIAHSIDDGFLPQELLGSIGLVANIFVHPGASIRTRVALNNYKAMRAAIRKAIEGRPTLAELLHERQAARHPFRYAP